MRVLLLLIAGALAGCHGGGLASDAGDATGGGGSAGDGGAASWWHPPVAATWDWQLATPVATSASVAVYDIDMFDNDASLIATLHQAGRKVICYIDIGSWENYRPDASQFPASVLGVQFTGFPDEKWLDIRQLDVLGPIMSARFDQAKSKGCDAIEPDNMDGYDTTAHESTGFPLTADDQLKYNRWAADQVHARGMAVGLKNDGAQVMDLVGDVDFAVSEQAFEYMEQDAFVPFISAGKPVFECEYNLTASQFCAQANMMMFSSIIKNTNLDSYRVGCQ